MNPTARQLRTIDLAGILGCGGIVAALVFGALLPLLQHRGDAELRRSELMKQRNKVAAAKASIQTLQTQIADARVALAGHPVRLESARAINHRLARIDALASVHGLNIDGIDPGGVVRGARYQTVDLTLTGTGRYRQYVQFLRDVHDQLPDMAVTAMQLSGNPAPPDAALSFKVQIRWYAAPVQVTAAE